MRTTQKLFRLLLPLYLYFCCNTHHASVSAANSVITGNHVVEARVYLDQEAVTNWKRKTGKGKKDLEIEMKSLFYEVSKIYESLDSVNIKVVMKDLYYLNYNILPTNRQGNIVSSVASYSFKSWVSSKGYSYSNPYDIALLLTGHNLVKTLSSTKDSSNGNAYIGAACTSKGVGVLEYQGNFMDVLIAAHEIGHIMGADHDGGSGDYSSCPMSDKHVMTPLVDPNNINHFTFSRCSSRAIRNYVALLNRRNRNCLLKTTVKTPTNVPRFGSLMSADEVCTRKFGPSSYVSRRAYTTEGYGDDVCVRLACMTRTVGTQYYWNFTATAPGTICGKNKRCDQGKCVTSSTPSSVIYDTCPYGDQPKIEGSFNTSCGRIDTDYCNTWKYVCCQTCNPNRKRHVDRYMTADEVCQILQGPTSSFARRAYNRNYATMCSKLSCLSSMSGTYFNWKFHTAPDGMKCGKNKICMNKVCKSSTKFGSAQMSDTCPYGDQPFLEGAYQSTCPDIVRRQGCPDWLKATCCKTCNN